MRIEVDHDKCIGCGMCIRNDEENFTYDNEGYAISINNNVTDNTIEAKECCPVDAISIVEEK